MYKIIISFIVFFFDNKLEITCYNALKVRSVKCTTYKKHCTLHTEYVILIILIMYIL